MPVFQDLDREDHPYQLEPWGHRAGEGDGSSTTTPDQPMKMTGCLEDEPMPDLQPSQQETEAEEFPKFQTSNRQELIRSIKRGESPTWIPNPSVSN